MQQLATAARNAVGALGISFSAPGYGTAAHAELGKLIKGSPEYFSEISYRDGVVVPYGTPDSRRAEVVFGVDPTKPEAIFDFKTGRRGISGRWRSEIWQHVPDGYNNIPIIALAC